MTVITINEWGRRAEAFLEAALYDARSGDDAIPNTAAAGDCLRIEAGEMKPDPDLRDLGDTLLGVDTDYGRTLCECNFGHSPYYLGCPLNAR